MRAAPQPGRLLRQVLAAAASATDGDRLLEQVAPLLAGPLGDVVVADRLADPDLVVRVAVVGLDGPLPLPDVAGRPRSRRSSAGSTGLLPRLLAAPGQVLRLDEAALTALADDPDPRVRAQAGFARQLGGTGAVLLALGARDRPLGALSLLTIGEPLDEDAVALARDVARALGLALDALRLREVQRDLALALQASLLPPLPQVPGLELAARCSPAASGLDVGGDWYDVFAPGPDGVLDLVIGDAAGHDTRAATRMAELRHALRTLAVDRAAGPGEVLERLDRALAALGVDGGATCLHARLAPPDGRGRRRLTWSSAGHLPPVLVGDGAARLLDRPADLMLGVDAGSRRSEASVLLAPGDVLLLCTDGLVEHRRIDLDTRLELLRAAVERIGGDDPEALADQLVAELTPDSEDDVALLVVRLLPLAEQRPLPGRDA